MRIRPVPPYQALAAIYDQLMMHVDYPMWADYTRELWRRHGGGRLGSAFDAACGTGRFLAALKEPRLRLAGADGCAAMLEQARRRLPRTVALSCQDLRELAMPGRWDLVTCLYDSLNYLEETDDLRSALARLGALVAPRGLLVFDVCTERNSLSHFNDRQESGRAEEVTWERHSWYDRPARLHHNEFLLEDEQGRRWAEAHRQRIYAIEEVEAVAAEAGLSLLGRYADFTLLPGSEQADRVHFAARPTGSQV
ncbi:MAG: class I SAM-dependent methyltransferase [bacterium]|nr:class I SAM-dependent methyltransferase [bacterium]